MPDCQAPLPDGGGEIAVDCVYCGAGNVLGLDLRGDATPTLQQAQGLEQALAARGREARLWAMMTAVAALLLIGGSAALAMSVGGSMLLPDIAPILLKSKAGTMAEPVARRRPIPRGQGHRAHGQSTRTMSGHKAHSYRSSSASRGPKGRSYKSTTVSRGQVKRSQKSTTVARGNARYSGWVRGKSWSWHGWSRPLTPYRVPG